MADKYCFLTIGKIKTMAQMKKIHEHNFREKFTPNANPALEHRNQELINKTKMDYIELWNERILDAERQTGIKYKKRKNGVLAYEIVLTFSKDESVDIEKWKKSNVRWLQKYFGQENVLSAQFHGDETGNVHIHAFVVPINEKGKLCAKDFTGGAAKLHQMQTDYGKAMAVHGLKRGLENSRAKHEDLRKFYASLNNAIEEEVPEQEEGELFDDYVLRVNEFLKTKNMQHIHENKEAEKKYNKLQTMFFNYQKKYKKARALYDYYEKQYGTLGADERFDALLANEMNDGGNKNAGTIFKENEKDDKEI